MRLSLSGRCPHNLLSQEGCWGWASLTSSLLKSNPGSAVCTLHTGMGEVGLQPSRGRVFSFHAEASGSSLGCAFPMGRNDTSLLWGPKVPALLYHSKDYHTVPMGPSDCPLLPASHPWLWSHEHVTCQDVHERINQLH